MDKTLTLFVLLLLMACGKDNKSGVPGDTAQNPVEVRPLEENLRQDYKSRGMQILKIYNLELRQNFGNETYHRMRENFKNAQIYFSYQLLTDMNGNYALSSIQDGGLILYVGEEDQSLNWSRRMLDKGLDVDRLILHDILELSLIDDSYFRFTRRIIPWRERR